MALIDLPEVMAIERASFTPPWSFLLFLKELKTNEFAHYFVAKTDKVVGYIGIWVVLDEMHITNFAVDPNCRRQGVGRKLMETILGLAPVYSTKEITLEVRVSNSGAKNLYKDFGFVEVGIRPGYYTDNNEDALIMTLYLTEAVKGGTQ